MTKRGIALVTVLIMITILTMMLVALYVAVRGGLISASVQSRRVRASYAAEAGLADAMSALETSGFSLSGSSLSDQLSSGGSYQIQFKENPPFGPLDSVSNLHNDSAALDSYHGPATVPPQSALIIARGEFEGVERVIEALVTRGGERVVIINALQSTGTVRLRGTVEVDAFAGLGDVGQAPGNVQSNADSGVTVEWDNSVSGSTANITGTVSSQGGTIDLAGYTPGGGSPLSGTVGRFPAVDIGQRVAARTGSPPPSISPLGATTLEPGEFYQSGNVTVNGDLVLEETDLFIAGDLRVNGSITGDGSIFVTGDTDFLGDATVSASVDKKVALLSQGNVTLSGFNGSEFLESVATTDPEFERRLGELQFVFETLEGLIGDASSVETLLSESHSTLDQLRRSLGDDNGRTGVNGPFAGTEGDLTGKLALALDTQPESPARDFLIEKLAFVSDFFDSRSSSVFRSPQGNELSPDEIVARWLAEAEQIDEAHRGVFDATIDSGNAEAMGHMINITNQIDYNKLGTSYFQGLVYTNGHFYANNEVNVVGAVLVDGDSERSSTSIDGFNLEPGDLVIDNNVRVTFVKEFFNGRFGSLGLSSRSLSVETWLGR